MNNDKKNKETDINFSGEKKTTGRLHDKFDFSLWFLKNRAKFFIGTVLFLLVLSAGLYLFSFYNLYDYISGSKNEKGLLQELTNINVNLTAGRTAIDLETGNPQSFSHNNKYDFIAKIKNPNSNFFAQVNYCFFSGEIELACGDSMIFPEETKYLIALATNLDGRPNNLNLVLKNINWERVDSKKYPDWAGYFSDHSNFIISEAKFMAEKAEGSSSGYIDNVSFSIKNNSAYNYWEVPLFIILFKGENIVGINKYTISEFMSLDQKDINLSWINSIKSVDRVEVTPDVNILDEDNYIRYK